MSNGRIGPPWWLMARGGAGESRTVSGPVAHWEDKVIAPLRSLVANIDPVQDLHGYDNPWPAGGGKNLFNKNGTNTGNGYMANRYLYTNGSAMTPMSGTWFISEYIPVEASTDYTISGLSTIDSTSPCICFYTANHEVISGSQYNNRASFSVQTPNNAAYVRLSVGPTSAFADTLQYEKGSTATTYAPYSNICPISGWSAVNVWVKPTYDPTANPTATLALGQTVYGGTLDVTNGVLTVDRAMVDLGDFNWRIVGSRFGVGVAYKGSGSNAVPSNILCSCYKNIAYNTAEDMAIALAGDGDLLVVKDTRYTTYEDFKTAVTGQTLVYELATPITIPLTPQEISTLQGQNNVWADSGDVTVTYLSGEGNPALVALALAHRIEE